MGQLECARLLLEANATVDLPQDGYVTALLHAVVNDRPPVVKLLEAKASTSLRGGPTDEDFARARLERMGHNECIQLLRWMNTLLDVADADKLALRFAVGDRVLRYASTRADKLFVGNKERTSRALS